MIIIQVTTVNMTQYEYKFVDTFSIQIANAIKTHPEKQFNELGSQGWNLITIHNNVAIFSRPLQ